MEGQECIHKIRIRCAWFRKTGDKQIIQQGSWAVLGMEIECVLLHLLPSVPSIAFDQQHKRFLFFDALAIKLCHGVMKKQIKNTQCWPVCPIHDKLHKRMTVLIRVEGVRHHLWLHYPLTSASPFPNYYNLFQKKWTTGCGFRREWLSEFVSEYGKWKICFLQFWKGIFLLWKENFYAYFL